MPEKRLDVDKFENYVIARAGALTSGSRKYSNHMHCMCVRCLRSCAVCTAYIDWEDELVAISYFAPMQIPEIRWFNGLMHTAQNGV